MELAVKNFCNKRQLWKWLEEAKTLPVLPIWSHDDSTNRINHYCSFLLRNEIFLVADNERPIVSCPNNVSMVGLDPGMIDASVRWLPMPTANDTVDGPIDNVNIVCKNQANINALSTDRYSVGTTTVTCSATDMAQNEGSCSFEITVVGRF